MAKFKGTVSVILEVDAPDAIQAEEDMAVQLIHMVRNDEIAFNVYRLSERRDGDKTK